ncbi:MAG TPA: BrnT family toxin [Planctomycetota bacterium]|nr:BrnT family toxin [Planctomycetota bacterium]
MEGFEWDPAKAKANLKRHGVSFAAGARVFDDRDRLEWLDTREEYGEERFVTVGEVNAELLSVAYTIRGELVRIISARRASRKEKAEYHDNRSI